MSGRFEDHPTWQCKLTNDDSVPVSKLPVLVYETKKDLADHGILSTIVGHVGDGVHSCFSPSCPLIQRLFAQYRQFPRAAYL